ncbi:hypothetical protein [Colwellia sp.]|nr:hypothetical protein [Colwellia sp.]
MKRIMVAMPKSYGLSLLPENNARDPYKKILPETITKELYE